MNKKDLAYLKRRLNVEHCHITSIRGMYVNGRKEPISAFEVLPVRTSKEDIEKYCAIFKRVLSGEDAQNLLTVDFTPEQVISGEEYGLLTELKDMLSVPSKHFGDVDEVPDNGDLSFLHDIHIGDDEPVVVLCDFGKLLLCPIEQCKIIFIC